MSIKKRLYGQKLKREREKKKEEDRSPQEISDIFLPERFRVLNYQNVFFFLWLATDSFCLGVV
jgi:hypothetical protein